MKIEFQYEELLFLLWVFLMLPWVFLAPLSGMAFDAGPKVVVYFFVCGIWTYPVSVWVVWKFRGRVPLIALLPCLNIAVWVICGRAA